MSNNGVDVFTTGSPPPRPRHQIKRSITELSSPIRLHRQSSLHRQNSRRKGDKERDRDRDRDERAGNPHSANPGLQNETSRLSFDGSRSEGMTPSLSPDASRRASILVVPGDESSAALSAAAMQLSILPTSALLARATREDGARQGRQRVAAQENGLKKAILDLNDISNVTARRLDDTYYSVLEKLGSLQNTILALKDLAQSSHDMNAAFNKESRELVDEVNTQLDSFGTFNEQQRRIESLQVRIYKGRDKVKVLSDRVDTVRDRIEGWERADREWQERTRRRLKATWTVISIILGIMVLLYVSAQYAPVRLEEATEATVKFANDSLNTLKNVTMSVAWDSNDTGGATNASDVDQSGIADDLLRMFDDL